MSKSWCLRWGVSGNFSPFWKQTNQVVTDTLIRPLVALLHQFSKKARYVVVAVFPMLKQVGQIPIKAAPLLTWLAFGKRSCSQPTLYRTGSYSNLSGNSGLTQAELSQSNDLLIVSQALLTPTLLKAQERWGGSGGSVGLPNGCLLIKDGLRLTFALRCQMARQQPLQGLSQILQQMEPIRTLNGLGSAFSRGRGIFPSPIPADRHEIWVLAHPGCRGVRFPIR